MPRGLVITIVGKNQRITVEVENFETVRHMKGKIAEQIGVSVDNLRFLVGNQNDDTKIGEMDLSLETILQVAVIRNGELNYQNDSVDFHIPLLPAKLDDTKDSHNYRAFCSGTSQHSHDFPIQPASARVICRKCDSDGKQSGCFTIDARNPPTTWEQVKRNKVKGCCFTCTPVDENFDFENPPARDGAQIFFRCQGKVYERSLVPVALFSASNPISVSPFNSNAQIEISNARTLRDLAESLTTRMQLLSKGEDFHFLAATPTGTFGLNRKIIDYGPDTYFVATTKNEAKPICIIFPAGLGSNLHISTTCRNQNVAKSINCYSTLKELRQTIAQMFTGNKNAALENFSLFEAKSLNNSLDREIGNFSGSTIIVSKAIASRCKADSTANETISVLDFSHVSLAECPLTCGPIYEPYVICASPCNHKFSVAGFYEYLDQATVPSIIAINSNEKSKDLFPFIVKCPMGCSGGVSLNAARIHPRVYKTLKKWVANSHEIAQGAIFCGLPSHCDIPYFHPKEGFNDRVIRVHCPVCEVDICKKHGTEWKLGNCECLPKKTLDPSSIASSIEETLNKGAFSYCPTCNAAIQRSDKCTHMKCDHTTNGRKCGTLFCYFCSKRIEFLRGSTFKSDHNTNWQNRKDRCAWFLSCHPLFASHDNGELRTQMFQYYKTLRLLRELKSDFLNRNMSEVPEGYLGTEWEQYLLNVWADALRRKEHLWADCPFDYTEGLKSDFPSQSAFQCSLP